MANILSDPGDGSQTVPELIQGAATPERIAAEVERFLSDPVTYCGQLTDPISRMRFRPRPDSPRFTHAGVTYYFEDQQNRALFESDPETLRLPGWKM